MRFKQFYLTEKVFGKLATVYHRTGRGLSQGLLFNFLGGDEKNLLAKIKREGFKTGYGDMYGKGIYTTFDLKSQFDPTMDSTYGSVIIKIKANLQNVLIFVESVAKLVYGKNHTIADQLRSMGFKDKIIKDIELTSIVIENDWKLKKNLFTSDHALDFTKRNKHIIKKLDGIMFNGRRDGNVLVIYKPELAVPISFNSTFSYSNKLDRKWIDIKNKELIKKSLEVQELGIKYEKKKLEKFNSIKFKKGGFSDLEDYHTWFLDEFVTSKNLELEVDEFNIKMKSGNLTLRDVKTDGSFEPTLIVYGGKLESEPIENIIIHGGEVHSKHTRDCTLYKKGKMFGKTIDHAFVLENSQLVCDTLSLATVTDNAKVKCRRFDGVVYKNGVVECDECNQVTIEWSGKIICKYWNGGSVMDTGKVICKVWKGGILDGNSKGECDVWENGRVSDNAQLKCKVWKNGSVGDIEGELGNPIVYCDVWESGNVKENAKIYIKGKLAKIENGQVVQ